MRVFAATALVVATRVATGAVRILVEGGELAGEVGLQRARAEQLILALGVEARNVGCGEFGRWHGERVLVVRPAQVSS